MTLALLAASFGLVYGPVLVRLAQDWWNDDNYSHGFLIIPLALYLAWERRERVLALPVRPAALGLGVVAASLAILVAGSLGAEMFLTRVSLIGTLAGSMIFLWGWARLRMLMYLARRPSTLRRSPCCARGL